MHILTLKQIAAQPVTLGIRATEKMPKLMPIAEFKLLPSFIKFIEIL